MKRYKTWEVVKMLAENPNLKFKDKSAYILTTCKRAKCFLDYTDIYGKRKSITNNLIIEDEWELIQESVTFEEVLNSDKKCRVEHEHINYRYFSEKARNILNNFNTLDLVLFTLSDFLQDPGILKEIIKNGEWYLE